LINDQIIWIDEALTPDSSRYWDQEKYSPGEEPNSYDKQYVRDYLRSLDQKLENDSIELPDFIINQTRERYEMAYQRILAP
jgi:phosphoribosylaminoimidazole-succinocarboxamide synthase